MQSHNIYYLLTHNNEDLCFEKRSVKGRLAACHNVCSIAVLQACRWS